MRAAAALLCALLLPSVALADGWRGFTWKWSKRATGAVLAMVVHEGCHLATNAAMDAEQDLRWGGFPPLTLYVAGLDSSQMQGSAWAGQACQIVVAETLLWTGWSKRYDVAWGFVAYHGIQSTTYAFRWDKGDGYAIRQAGGNQAAFSAVNAIAGTSALTRLWLDAEGVEWRFYKR